MSGENEAMKHFANNLNQFLPQEDVADSQEKLTLEEFYKRLYKYELFDFQKQLVQAMHEKKRRCNAFSYSWNRQD